MKRSEALDILGLSGNPSADEIKRAHRKKVIAHHPDKFPVGSPEHAQAEEQTKRINEARDCLDSGRWEPEFGGARSANGAGYGTGGASPYGGYTTVSWEDFIRSAGAAYTAGSTGADSKTRPNTGSGYPGASFVDFDFSSIPHVSYVYTTSSSTRTESTNPVNEVFGGSPFGSSAAGSIFDAIFGGRPESPAERLRAAQTKLSSGVSFLLASLLVLLVLSFAGHIFAGLILFAIASTAALVQGRELSLIQVMRVAPVVFALGLVLSLIPFLWLVGLVLFAALDLYLLGLCVRGILKTRQLIATLKKAVK